MIARIVVAALLLAALLAVGARAITEEGEPAVSPPPATTEEAPPAVPPSPPTTTDDSRPPTTKPPRPKWPRVRWRRSLALGVPWSGRLLRGVRLPRAGRHFFTWDPILKRSPNRHWRRWGTRRLVRLVLRLARRYRIANPDAPRVAIGDLSRPRGGDFGPRFGGIGHVSHQNGLDVDIYYPRRDGRELRPAHVRQVDLELSQDLLDRFVAAGAEIVFVGPSTPLRGPRRRVQPLVHHDDHMHVRLPARPGAPPTRK